MYFNRMTFRSSFVSLMISLAVVASPVAVPGKASAQTNININIGVGTSLNSGRGITCSQGERLLRNRGFRDIRRVDCRGRFFVYRAWRGNTRFEIGVRQFDGRIVDMRRIDRRR
ncbi:hypothetical protein LPJGGPFB_03538 [Ensifer adhaerens]|uniref:Uncharacterized protein n=1 Tax=Ensifer adhaerens TaxID=106592 RepID=A0ACC5SRU2_ENSAD|nr:hypothetical protein [Ensifer adhaerens]MBP1871518.1 hypothetical protein [Ensifer adhaerens]NRP20279.1 hypothetical protein [Ensifer adhaerens]